LLAFQCRINSLFTSGKYDCVDDEDIATLLVSLDIISGFKKISLFRKQYRLSQSYYISTVLGSRCRPVRIPQYPSIAARQCYAVLRTLSRVKA